MADGPNLFNITKSAANAQKEPEIPSEDDHGTKR